MRNGAHMKKKAGQTAKNAVIAGLAGSGALAAFVVILAVMATSRILSATWKAAVHTWERLRVRGRLIAAMVASPFLAIFAGNLGLIPSGDIAALISGLAGVAFFGMWLWAFQKVSQWRWRRRRGIMVPGSLGAHILSTSDRVTELEAQAVMSAARIAELEILLAAARAQSVAMEAKLAGIFTLMAETSKAMGLPVQASNTPRAPRRLRLVTEDRPGRAELAL